VLWGFWEGCEEAVLFIFMIISGRVDDVLLDSNSDELLFFTCSESSCSNSTAR
jgi:hypothetical protein